MKLTFNQTANGTYELEFKVSTDFNLHVERTDASQDLYVYYRGSSEGEYKFYKKYYGKVVDEDINIVDNIVPKFFKVKSASNPVLCEVTGEVEVVIGGEDKPEGGSAREMVYLNYDRISDSALKELCKKYATIFAGEMDGLVKKITEGTSGGAVIERGDEIWYGLLNKEVILFEE